MPAACAYSGGRDCPVTNRYTYVLASASVTQALHGVPWVMEPCDKVIVTSRRLTRTAMGFSKTIEYLWLLSHAIHLCPDPRAQQHDSIRISARISRQRGNVKITATVPLSNNGKQRAYYWYAHCKLNSGAIRLEADALESTWKALSYGYGVP